jgi:ribosomal protein S12 methylthiotransferase
LIQLLEEILRQTSIPWIRILYGYPEEITPELLELFQEKRLCPYLDLPFQHAHPRLIKAMRRGLDGPRALRLIEKIRSKIPDVALRTSLIVGFPGETTAEFAALMEFVARAEFDHLGVFTYSPEKDTPNYALGDPVPAEEKERRRQEIMRLQAEISRRRNRRFLHQRLQVLVEESAAHDQKYLLGRSRYQAPEVDGVIYLQPRHQKYTNSLQEVIITSTGVYDLKGRVVK